MTVHQKERYGGVSSWKMQKRDMTLLVSEEAQVGTGEFIRLLLARLGDVAQDDSEQIDTFQQFELERLGIDGFDFVLRGALFKAA